MIVVPLILGDSNIHGFDLKKPPSKLSRYLSGSTCQKILIGTSKGWKSIGYFRVSFQNFQRSPSLLLYGSPPKVSSCSIWIIFCQQKRVVCYSVLYYTLTCKKTKSNNNNMHACNFNKERIRSNCIRLTYVCYFRLNFLIKKNIFQFWALCFACTYIRLYI